MRRASVAAISAAAVIAAGCGTSAADEAEAEGAEAACENSAGPVTEEMLVDTLADHGFQLFPEACEPVQGKPTIWMNDRDGNWTAEDNATFDAEGIVSCWLTDGSQLSSDVRRTRTDSSVNLRVLNVECSIVTTGFLANDGPLQIERLEAALRELPNLVD